MFTFLVSLLIAFLGQKANLHNINFVFGSYFEQDHLLNLIILGVYAKKWLKCARIWKQKLIWSKIWSIIFFVILTVRRPFHKKDFK